MAGIDAELDTCDYVIDRGRGPPWTVCGKPTVRFSVAHPGSVVCSCLEHVPTTLEQVSREEAAVILVLGS